MHDHGSLSATASSTKAKTASEVRLVWIAEVVENVAKPIFGLQIDSYLAQATLNDVPRFHAMQRSCEGFTTVNRPHSVRPGVLLVALAFTGFISLGLPDAVLGVAWPSVRNTFELRQGAIAAVLVVSGAGYLLSSFLAGRLLSAFGIGLVLTTSTSLVAVAMYGFAFSACWATFVVCALVHGLGSGAIDSGLNGYAAHSMTARQMNWLHACYCLGALIGPVLMSKILAGGRHYSAGYAAVGGIMLTMSVLFLLTYRLWDAMSVSAAPSSAEQKRLSMGALNALRSSVVWCQMAVFFLYTGLEVTFSQWTFSVLTESRRVNPETAGLAVGLFWGAIGTGRVASGLIADRVGIDRLLRYCLMIAGIGAMLFATRVSVSSALLGLTFVGLGLAPIYPCLMSQTPQRLGRELSVHAIGFQVGAAMIGAAVVPGALGILAGRAGLEALAAGTVVLFGVLILLHEGLVRSSGVLTEELAKSL